MKYHTSKKLTISISKNLFNLSWKSNPVLLAFRVGVKTITQFRTVSKVSTRPGSITRNKTFGEILIGRVKKNLNKEQNWKIAI